MKHLWMAALCAAWLGHALPAVAQTSWKLATGYKPESFHTRNIVQFSQDVAQATSGGLSIEVVPDNLLARLADIPRAVREGQAQAGETILTGMVGEIPLAGADAVPFVVTSYADAQRLWKLQRPGLERHFTERGLRLLYTVPWPPQGLHSVLPIRGKADFAGRAMRTYNPTTRRIAELLGATPVDVATAEVGQALAEGRVDSMITSAITGVENKVWASTHYYYEVNAWFPKNAVFVSNKAFDALAPAVQAEVLKAAATAERRGWAASQALATSATDELRRNGIKVERIPPDLDRDIRRMGERFSREWVRSVGNEANDIFIPYYLTP